MIINVNVSIVQHVVRTNKCFAVPDEEIEIKRVEVPLDVEEADEELGDIPDIEEDEDLSHPLSTAEILARREQLVTQYKFRIGLLCSALLEDPQNKVQ